MTSSNPQRDLNSLKNSVNMKLSKSKINSYLKCPLEFKFQYIDEIEVEPNKYMVLGSDVHSVAETFADRFGDELENVNIQNELVKIANDLEMGPDIADHVDNLGLFFKEVFVDNDYKLFSQEEYLLDENHRFSGICDIILEDENEDLVVIDYKTSDSGKFSRYRRELCYYKLLVENKRKYLNSTEINEAIDTFYKVRYQVNKRNFYPKKQFLCRFCTYKHICDEYY